MTVEQQDDRLRALLQPPPATATRFPPPSRYAAVDTTIHDPDGELPVVHLRRRFVPRPESLTGTGEHVVVAGERTDHIAAAALGDPQLYWRLCDGNRAVRAEALVAEPGRRLRITAPEPGGAP